MTRDTTDDGRDRDGRPNPGESGNSMREDGGAEPLPDGGAEPLPDGGAEPLPDGGDRLPDETDLDELREEIREIDHDIVELIARRTYVADTIAQVKEAEGLPTTDEAQEERVMERAGENAARFDVDANLVKAIFRLLIELNKVEQRESR